MKKNSNKIIMNTNELASGDHVNKDIEIFKSRVANAVLDYMEAQSDSDLIECLEKASIFLNNISLQMENVFDNQKQSFKDQNDVFDIGDDLFSINTMLPLNFFIICFACLCIVGFILNWVINSNFGNFLKTIGVINNAQTKNHIITTYQGKLAKPQTNIEIQAGNVSVDNIFLIPL